VAAGKHGSAWTRHLRRFFSGFLSAEDKKRIAGVIAEQERKTTGAITVHLVGKAGPDIMAAARKLFVELGLDKTEQRNGVLLLISHLDHRFAIWGDEGIHDQAGQHLWDRAAKILLARFKDRKYAEGVESCVREIGAELARRCPKMP